MMSLKTWLSNFLKAVTLVWLVCHFTLTFLYVMPLTPLKAQLLPLLDVTIGAYFQQNWSLFAPNPISSDEALLVRCLTAAEMSAKDAAGLPASGWHDVSTPLWQHFQRNRFSAYDRLGRPQSNAMRQYMTGGFDLEPWVESCRKGSEQSCAIVKARLAEAQARSGVMLSRIGSAYCRDTAVDDKHTHVALRMRRTDAAPWSERFTGKRQSRDFELGIYPIDVKVAAMGLFKTGVSR
jgi:hypothetical protein